jgi:hypothetical protein
VRSVVQAPDKSLGVANRNLATINAIHPDGYVCAHLKNNRQIGFNAREYDKSMLGVKLTLQSYSTRSDLHKGG